MKLSLMDMYQYWLAEILTWIENTGNTDTYYTIILLGAVIGVFFLLLLIRAILGWMMKTNTLIALMAEQNQIQSERNAILEDMLAVMRDRRVESR